MNIRFEKLGLRFHLGVNLTRRVQGVNSTLKDGLHLVLWDFDNVDLWRLLDDLRSVQEDYCLPSIHVLSTGIPRHFHAYCFASRTFKQVEEILLNTPSVDKVFRVTGSLRGYFTLRISDKQGREFAKVMQLLSPYPVECSPEDVATFSSYTTKRR